jgi:hypothetical protein
MGTDHILRGRYHRKPTVMDCFTKQLNKEITYMIYW